MRKNLLKISAVGMMILFVSVAGAKVPLETPTTKAAFEKIVGELKTEAKAFTGAGDDKGPTQSKVVGKLQYSADSSTPLIKTLKALSEKPLEKLYITHQLISPMTKASDETIRPLVPMLIDSLQKDCRYKSMPKCSRRMLAALNPPPMHAHDKNRSKVAKLRQETFQRKAASERLVVKHNRTVNALEKTIKQLLVLIGDRAADEALLKRLAYEHDRRQATFEDTLAIIKSEAGQMKQDRAKKFYDRLQTLALRSNRPGQYSDPTKPVYKADKKSSFASRKVHFAASTLKVVNILATAAKEPAVKIPGEKPPKKPRRRRRRR